MGFNPLGLHPTRMPMASSWHPQLRKHEPFLIPKVLPYIAETSLSVISQLARDQNTPCPLTSRMGGGLGQHKSQGQQGCSTPTLPQASSQNTTEFCNRDLQTADTHMRPPLPTRQLELSGSHWVFQLTFKLAHNRRDQGWGGGSTQYRSMQNRSLCRTTWLSVE